MVNKILFLSVIVSAAVVACNSGGKKKSGENVKGDPVALTKAMSAESNTVSLKISKTSDKTSGITVKKKNDNTSVKIESKTVKLTEADLLAPGISNGGFKKLIAFPVKYRVSSEDIIGAVSPDNNYAAFMNFKGGAKINIVSTKTLKIEQTLKHDCNKLVFNSTSDKLLCIKSKTMQGVLLNPQYDKSKKPGVLNAELKIIDIKTGKVTVDEKFTNIYNDKCSWTKEGDPSWICDSVELIQTFSGNFLFVAGLFGGTKNVKLKIKNLTGSISSLKSISDILILNTEKKGLLYSSFSEKSGILNYMTTSRTDNSIVSVDLKTGKELRKSKIRNSYNEYILKGDFLVGKESKAYFFTAFDRKTPYFTIASSFRKIFTFYPYDISISHKAYVFGANHDIYAINSKGKILFRVPVKDLVYMANSEDLNVLVLRKQSPELSVEIWSSK
ncbi:MAG: hypothetical protein JXR95_09010 [Deltaproteobacteria bacterium]|nr:hypothetical protein [Deltaproteobacteria bacterium]